MTAAYPDVEGWLDRLQIVGGDDLIEKLASGIDEAQKFLVFLSERSVTKLIASTGRTKVPFELIARQTQTPSSYTVCRCRRYCSG